jgi:Flp pilus assembly pilin Flp
MTALLSRVLRDEEGTATIEYAFVMGLIVLAAISVISAFGTKVVAKWNSVGNGLH